MPVQFSQFALLGLLLFLSTFLHFCFSQSTWSTADQKACVQQCMSTGVNCSSGCGYVDSCATGWRGLIKRRCYTIRYPTTPGYTWAQAQSQCQANGSDLPSIHSEMENSFLVGLILNTVNPDGKNHNFWTGQQLTRDSTGAVTGSSWSDGSAMDYGNPVTGRGVYPWATGEPVNAGNCVRMMGYSTSYRGLWYDCDCNQATTQVPTSGYFCKGCPAGWTAFNGHCYKAFIDSSQAGTLAQFQRLCSIFNSSMVSIHSSAENDFVLNLAQKADPTTVAIMIGLRLGWAAYPDYWVDGTPVDFGANTRGGIYPWADTGTGYPNQPDRNPYPGDCVLMWMDQAMPANKEPGRWDDITCTMSPIPGTVCKF